MALVKDTLKAAIVVAFAKQAAKTAQGDSPALAAEELADDIATAIDAFVKTGTVNSTVVGSSPSGPVTGTATGTMT